MAKDIDIGQGIDWTTIWIYIILVCFGLANIYAAVYNVDNPVGLFSLEHNAGRQLLFLVITVAVIFLILFIDFKVYDTFAYILYGFWILVLIATIFLGSTINGSKSWIKLGAFSLQPAEFAKTITALALSKYLTSQGVNMKRWPDIFKALAIIFVPPIIIIMQKETGSALTFAIFLVVLYRQGLPAWIPVLAISFMSLLIMSLVFPQWVVLLILGALTVIFWYWSLKRYERDAQNLKRVIGVFVLFSAFVLTVDFFINNILQPHQQKRIKVLVNPDIDPLGAAWNVTQSKIAIGSGGLLGKGYLKGTQTKFDFVPEQSTDFIFCTVGEEWGFMGSLAVIALFFLLITRVVNLAEKQKSVFAKLYGYSVASIIFFHILVNIGMTIGLMPVIGIPLPFVSYGGSSLLSFSILLFIFLKLDAHRSYKV